MDLRTAALDIRFPTKSLSYQPQVFAGGSKWQITGPSGCGKSTFFRYLLNLIPESLINQKPSYDRQAFTWVPQEIQLGDGRTLALIQGLLGILDPLGAESRLERIQDNLQRWSWPSALWPQEFDLLSGGEKQRLALALALSLDRPWLLVDEGLTGIDPVLREIVLKDLQSSPQGILIISHQDLPFDQREIHRSPVDHGPLSQDRP
jgi:ABC-type Mn2+/Zn2+ transport system ATPase subunit